MDTDAEDVLWRAVDPLKYEVVLKKSTYDAHIIGDHSEEDGAERKLYGGQAKSVIERPRFIILLGTKGGRERLMYLDFVLVPKDGRIKLRGLTVIVEKDPMPREVVTWNPINKLKMNCLAEEVVYDGRKAGQ